jgi:hypothetical protein
MRDSASAGQAFTHPAHSDLFNLLRTHRSGRKVTVAAESVVSSVSSANFDIE